MAESLKTLESLPLKLQEKLLKELSVLEVNIVLEEIEIDGKMYRAEKEVLKLIDGLVMQLEKLENKMNKYES
tara:strand:- start:5834 stop:6049 length:216 start_codon:yes stop_codon:yes gene_type:complete